MAKFTCYFTPQTLVAQLERELAIEKINKPNSFDVHFQNQRSTLFYNTSWYSLWEYCPGVILPEGEEYLRSFGRSVLSDKKIIVKKYGNWVLTKKSFFVVYMGTLFVNPDFCRLVAMSDNIYQLRSFDTSVGDFFFKERIGEGGRIFQSTLNCLLGERAQSLYLSNGEYAIRKEDPSRFTLNSTQEDSIVHARHEHLYHSSRVKARGIKPSDLTLIQVQTLYGKILYFGESGWMTESSDTVIDLRDANTTWYWLDKQESSKVQSASLDAMDSPNQWKSWEAQVLEILECFKAR